MQDYSLVPVGAGDTFLAAMQQGRSSPDDHGFTVARAVKNGTAKSASTAHAGSTRAVLGGDYPASCLYGPRLMEANKETAKGGQCVRETLKWMNTHSPEEIAAAMPKDFTPASSAYVQGLREGRAHIRPTA